MAKSTGRLTDIAAHALALEKHELYNRLVLLVCIYCSSKTLWYNKIVCVMNRLKNEISEGQKESIYHMFKIDLKAKQKKRYLVEGNLF